MKIDRLVLIGAGGTGTHLLEPLTRLLAYHPLGCKEVIIADGDKYEEKNLERQMFDEKYVDLNKAEAAAMRINFGKVKAISVQSFINRLDFRDIILDGVIEKPKEKNILIVLAVDNDATRRDIITAVDEKGLENFILVLPGNELDHGRCSVYAKKNGKKLTSNPLELYSNLKNPKDRIPGGCMNEAPAAPQLLSANAGAALAALWTIQAILDDYPVWETVVFDARRMLMTTNGDPILFDDRKLIELQKEAEEKEKQPPVEEKAEAAEAEVEGATPIEA